MLKLLWYEVSWKADSLSLEILFLDRDFLFKILYFNLFVIFKSYLSGVRICLLL